MFEFSEEKQKKEIKDDRKVTLYADLIEILLDEQLESLIDLIDKKHDTKITIPVCFDNNTNINTVEKRIEERLSGYKENGIDVRLAISSINERRIDAGCQIVTSINFLVREF